MVPVFRPNEAQRGCLGDEQSASAVPLILRDPIAVTVHADEKDVRIFAGAR
jgi:hypothetical protein